MKTLLVGVLEQDRDLAAAIAGHDFRMYLATTLAEGRSLLGAEGLDGIVVGVHFNDGDPFEFLRLVRAHPATAHLPFILVKAFDGRLHPESYKAIAAACACEQVPYIDAGELVQAAGRSNGCAHLRQEIFELL